MLTKTMHLDNSGELKYWTGELDCSENDPTHQAQSVCEWERGRLGEGATVRVVGSPTGSVASRILCKRSGFVFGCLLLNH
jgi:hypothetical protein